MTAVAPGPVTTRPDHLGRHDGVGRPVPSSGAATGRRPRDRRFAWLVAAAVAAGFVLRLAVGLTDDAPSSDETAYLDSGMSLVAGDGFTRDGRPELHFPPLVPFVLGVAAEVAPDPHTGAVAVTVVAGAGLVALLARLGRRVAGPAAGVATAWVAALTPGLATLPATRGAGSEAVYGLVVVGAVLAVAVAAERRGRARLGWVAAAGLLAGGAYLARPEGLVLVGPLGAAVLVMGARRAGPWPARVRSAAALGAALALPLAVCVVPYVWFLHEHTGSWAPTAKTRDASLEAWEAVARGDRESRDAVLYALDEDGLRFAADRDTLAGLARDDPAGYARIVATNVRVLGRTLGGVSLLPVPVWVLAAAGAWRLRHRPPVRLLVAVAALPVATALAFFVQPRYVAVTATLATVGAGAALAGLPAQWRRWAVPAVAVTLAAAVVPTFRGLEGWGRPPDHTEQRAAGEWVAAHTPPDARVMTRSMVVDFYAGRPTVALPYAELDEVVRFGRHYGTTHLVADESHIGRLRPQLAELLERDEVPGLRLVHELQVEGRTARIFAFDPAPPPAREAGPTLGFMGDV